MGEVTWAEPALQQLDTIASYIALDKPAAARAAVQRIFDATDHLERFKQLGRSVPEFPHSNYRQVWIRPCWIYYRVDGKDVRILQVRRSEQPYRNEDLVEDD